MSGEKVVVDSMFGGGSVLIDPWGSNALVDDFAASNTWAYSLAVKEAVAPRMFSGGTADLPPFTASGIDPRLLLQMPYGTRHSLAAEPHIATVQQAFEEDSTNPYANYAHPGLTAAIARVTTWATGQAFDPMAAMRAQEDEKVEAAAMQTALNGAFERGGKAASDALLAEYNKAAAERQADADRAYAAAMDAMNIAYGTTDRKQ